MMKLRLLVQWCGLALLAGTVAGCGGTLGTDAPELRETTYGVVRGRTTAPSRAPMPGKAFRSRKPRWVRCAGSPGGAGGLERRA